MTEEHRTDDTRERPSANIERIHQLVETLMPAAAAIMTGATQLDDPAQQAALAELNTNLVELHPADVAEAQCATGSSTIHIYCFSFVEE